jgi:hypothetical protein
MATLACTDYSPKNNHNWKCPIGTETFHEKVHGKFHKDVWDTFDHQSGNNGRIEFLY